jgi:hypothetical protein
LIPRAPLVLKKEEDVEGVVEEEEEEEAKAGKSLSKT